MEKKLDELKRVPITEEQKETIRRLHNTIDALEDVNLELDRFFEEEAKKNEAPR